MKAKNKPIEETHYINSFYRKLVNIRAERINGFIISRGFRNVRQRGDKTGVTYAFWLSDDKL